MLPVSSDIVKAAISGDEGYAERRKAARTNMRRNLAVRSGDIQQGRIMAQYARDTALTAKAEAPAASGGSS